MVATIRVAIIVTNHQNGKPRSKIISTAYKYSS